MDLTSFQRTVDNLRAAQRCLQQAQNSIGAAIRFNAMLPAERQMAARVKVDLVEPIDKLEALVNSVSIIIKTEKDNGSEKQ